MNDLNKNISKIVSPFDDGDPIQSDSADLGYLEFQRKEILNSIFLKNSRKTFDLYFDDVLNEVEDKIKFISDCFEKLVQTYAITVAYDKVYRENYIETNINIIIDCITYICKDYWLDSLVSVLPMINLEIIIDGERLYDFLNSNIDSLRNKIIKQEQINELIRYEMEYAPIEECVNFLFKLIQKDIPGVVSYQLANKE